MNLFKFIYLITFNFICSQKLIERTILDIKNNKELIIIAVFPKNLEDINTKMVEWIIEKYVELVS